MNMKKPRHVLILLAVMGVLILVVSLLPPWPGIAAPFLGTDEDDEFLLTSTSPDGTYALHAWRILEGATVANSIRVYRAVGPLTVCIYNGYREDKVSIDWLSDTVVQINGVVLDLSKGENYDWRR